MSLAAHRIGLRAGGRVLADALEFTLEPGDILGILGPNGAGKSTLLAVLAGLARPANGVVMLDGRPVADLPPRIRAQHIGLLPQDDDGGFFGNVADFVALGGFPFDRRADPRPQLAVWDLDDRARRPLATLSGGERQRARLAQLAVQRPGIMLLDEPLTHLDPAYQGRLMEWVRAEAGTGRGIALTLHDPAWTAGHCDRLLFLYGDGRWRLGTPATLLAPDALESLYGAGTARMWRRSAGVEPV